MNAVAAVTWGCVADAEGICAASGGGAAARVVVGNAPGAEGGLPGYDGGEGMDRGEERGKEED